MIAIIVTVLMFAVLLVGLLKNWNPTSWMLIVSLVFGMLWMLITGTSMLAEPTGNIIVDLFEIIEDSAISQFTSVILCIGVCMGYIAFLDQINAPAMFTSIVSRPLNRIGKPYLVCGFSVVIAALIKFVIPAPASVTALLIATLYPILRSVGVSSYSAASCIGFGAAMPWGPSNSFLYTAFSNAGLDTTLVTTWSLTTLLKLVIPAVIVAAVFVALISKIFDKKEGIDEGKTVRTLDLDGTPKIYAILPILPVIILLIFTFLLKINIGLVASLFISVFISLTVWVIAGKEKITCSAVLARLQPLYKETGAFLGGTGFLLIASNVFATVIGKIGGLNAIVDYATEANMSPQLLILVAIIIVVIMVALTGATIGMLPVFAPLFSAIAATTGTDPYILIGALIIAVSVSGPIGLVYMSNLVAADQMGTKLTTLSKRNIIPSLAVTAVGYIITIMLCF